VPSSSIISRRAADGIGGGEGSGLPLCHVHAGKEKLDSRSMRKGKPGVAKSPRGEARGRGREGGPWVGHQLKPSEEKKKRGKSSTGSSSGSEERIGCEHRRGEGSKKPPLL